MARTIELRTRIVGDLIRERRFDCFIVHYGESDTVAHQFWHLCDRESPRFVGGAPADAIANVYERMDGALAQLLEAAGGDVTVMVISDHGTGGTSDRAVFWNRWLAMQGHLRFRERAASASVSRLVRAAALRGVPEQWQSSLLAAMPEAAARFESGVRLGGIDWTHTTVFSEELSYFPSLWLNVRGREPRGVVEQADVAQLLDRLTTQLLGIRDPFDGGAVVERVRRRHEVASGPYAERLPDLVLELRRPDGYSYASMSSRAGRETEPVRKLRPDEMTGARGTSMAGAHRDRGLCILSGAKVRPGVYPAGSLADAGATALALCGSVPHPAADGCAWTDCVDVPQSIAPSRLDVECVAVDYSAEEEAVLADRLRALGYLS
jgi:predicted AlkP superfamily phosphohydrolase/phosphomutase